MLTAAIRLRAEGLTSGKVHRLILTLDQLANITAVVASVNPAALRREIAEK